MLMVTVWHTPSFRPSRGLSEKSSYLCRWVLQVFHAGTSSNNAGEVAATGGRVLGVTAVAADVEHAQRKAYQVGVIIAFAENLIEILLFRGTVSCPLPR